MRPYLLPYTITFFILLLMSCDNNKTSSQASSSSTTTEKKLTNDSITKDKSTQGNVLGWHRYDNDNNYRDYQYDILNMLAYFAYKVDPATGEQKNEIQWKTAPIIDSAKANGCKVYLTLENFGHTNNKQFFKSKIAQTKLIENVMKMVIQREVQGICVDFEEVPSSVNGAYNQFLLELSQALKKQRMDLIVVLQLYQPQNQVDPLLLGDAVDYYVMMGYACYHQGSSHAGPISPLRSGDTWEPYSLEPNIDAYLKASFPANKFMVALPLYGGVWETKSGEINSKSIKGISSPTVNSAMKNASGPILIDSISQSSYYISEVNGKIQQCWFEGKYSMTIKMQYIKDKGLAGIGLWALGYAEGNNEIWQSIDSVFNRP